MFINFIDRIKPGPLKKPAGRTLVLILSISFFSMTGQEQWQPEPYTLSYPASFGNRFTIPDDNPLTKEGVHLGRMLFYEKQLSQNNSLSCGTCHQQKLAFTDGRNFSQGVDGTLTRRNAMSLSNLLWIRNYFWDGRASSLEIQASVPLTDAHEMGQSMERSAEKIQNIKIYPPMFKKAFGTDEVSGDLIIKAIAQFERTLISADSHYDGYLRGEYTPSQAELQGLSIFTSMPSPEKKILGANCIHCHALPKTFMDVFHNNGLDSEFKDMGRADVTTLAEDRGRFRVPTLRNVALTGPYMHDGRFKTLEEVVDHYNEHVQPSPTLSPFVSELFNNLNEKTLALSDAEKKSLVSFLRMLTDSTFTMNPEFSNPNLSIEN